MTQSCFRAVSLALPVFAVFLAIPATAQEAQPDRAEIIHVLNRVTFGPRPGDVEMVEKMGLHNYLEQQLHPDSIDDSAVEQAVAGFDLLQMSAQDLSTMYQEERKNAMKKQLAAEKAANVTDGQIPAAMQDAPPPAPAMQPPPSGGGLQKALDKLNQVRTVAAIGQLEQARIVRDVDSNRQLQEVLVDFWGNHFNIDMKKGPDRVFKIIDDRDVIRPHIWGTFRALLEASAKSPAMLFYLDNASNTVQRTVTPKEQMVTERLADTMTANGNGAIAPPVPKVGDKKGGINENYGREIMELHTLGVDGGYTQNDVQEVARCFTGWTIDRQTGEFIFRPGLHDKGAKTVLGHYIPAGGGIEDGETVLDILCAHPATAHHIALEMCERFVSDDPPPALVDRIAGVFTQTGGDLRKVTAAILSSPEFVDPATYYNKVKSPLEFAVSAVRASGSTIIPQAPAPMNKIEQTTLGSAVLGRTQAADRITKRPRQPIDWHLIELGEPLFACTPPTGYTEVSRSWVSPGALIERLNFALALTQQELSDVNFNPQTILNGVDLDNPDAVLNQCVAVLLQNNITDATKKVLTQTALPAPGESKTVNPAKLIALLIGSPEFQKK